jgi:glutamate dehydrogenase/leucine dehydrogenase
VPGLGGVGAIVARVLVALGARVLGCDVDPDARARASAEGLTIVDVDAAFAQACDVLVPCALGGVIDPARARTLRARAVCGSANNQIVRDAARVLHERGIVHVPDIVASAGAVIEGVLVVRGGDTPDVRAQVAAGIAAIEVTAARVLATATAEGRPSVEIAESMARRAASVA